MALFARRAPPHGAPAPPRGRPLFLYPRRRPVHWVVGGDRGAAAPLGGPSRCRPPPAAGSGPAPPATTSWTAATTAKPSCTTTEKKRGRESFPLDGHDNDSRP